MMNNKAEELERFIKRAGFDYGWENLESWARRMAEEAVKELSILRDEIKRKNKLIEEVSNQLYVDTDGIGSISEAGRLIEQALTPEDR